jgi:hypothetical protein
MENPIDHHRCLGGAAFTCGALFAEGAAWIRPFDDLDSFMSLHQRAVRELQLRYLRISSYWWSASVCGRPSVVVLLGRKKIPLQIASGIRGDAEQSLAADGAIACFSSNLIPAR